MTIDLVQTSELYPYFYSLAFAIGLCIFIYEGIRRNYPLASWLLISASISFGLIFGSKVSTLDFSSLTALFQGVALPSTGKRTAYGAFLFAMLCLWLCRKYLRFRQPTLDAFAFYLPTIMLIQRFGCLSAGCCYGHATNLPWGISYKGVGFLRDSQINEGLIGGMELTSKPVHPVPVYFILAAFFTLVILFYFRNRIKTSGKLFALSILCMAVFRFIIEFFRHPTSNLNLANTLLGLKTIQWIIILLVGFLIYILLRKGVEKITNQETPITHRNLVIVAILAVAVFLLKGRFTPEEMVVLHAQIALASIITIYKYFTKNVTLAYKLAYFSILPLSLVLMGQTYPADTLNQNKSYFTTRITVNHFGEPSFPPTEIQQGCVGKYASERDYDKPMGPLYLSYTIGGELENYINPSSSFIMGIEGQMEHFINPSMPHTSINANLFPYFGVQGYKFFGFRAGIRVGSMYTDAKVIGGITEILPSGRLWFGYSPILTLHASVFDSEFVGAGPSCVEAKFNLNLSNYSRNELLVGGGIGVYKYLIDGVQPHYIFLETLLNSKENWAIKPQFGVTFFGNDFSFNAGIGLRYRYK